eukprot:1131779-Pyramimonas_sp.AAC.1
MLARRTRIDASAHSGRKHVMRAESLTTRLLCWHTLATQHPLHFARATARKKPSSRAAQRREMAARASSSVGSHERSTSPKTSGERTEYAAGRRKHSHHPHATSPPKAEPKPA